MKPRLFCNYTKNPALNPALTGTIGWLLLGWLHFGAPALAIDRATIELLTQPLEPALFQPNATLDPSIVTPDRISQTGLTPPSLWWTQQQFGNNLLSYWLAYPGKDALPGRVDLMVDQQIWNSYNYLQRYAFVNQFGTTAKEFRYNLRVFNLQGELQGAQICQFSPVSSADISSADISLNATCNIFLNAYGRGAFRGSTTSGAIPGAIPGASSPTGGDRALDR